MNPVEFLCKATCWIILFETTLSVFETKTVYETKPSNMSWHQLAENPQSLDSLYGTVPELENVELFAINLNREGEHIQLRFDLPTFPDKPPTRWHKDFNTVQLELSFWGIMNFEGKGWHRDMKAKIEIKSHNKGLEVLISNPEIDLRFLFQSEFFRIEKCLKSIVFETL